MNNRIDRNQVKRIKLLLRFAIISEINKEISQLWILYSRFNPQIYLKIIRLTIVRHRATLYDAILIHYIYALTGTFDHTGFLNDFG